MNNNSCVVLDLDKGWGRTHLQLRTHPQLAVVHPDKYPTKVGTSVTKHDLPVVDILLRELTHPFTRILGVDQFSVGSGSALKLDILQPGVDIHVGKQQVLLREDLFSGLHDLEHLVHGPGRSLIVSEQDVNMKLSGELEGSTPGLGGQEREGVPS